MSKNPELINLDVEEHKVIALTHGGVLKSFTRAQLLALLDQAAKAPIKAESEDSGVSLASIGNRASRLLRKAQRGLLPIQDQEKLTQAIDNFDGVIAGRATSPVFHVFAELLEIKGISTRLKDSMLEFINRYPQLKAIPVKERASGSDEKRQTQVENKSKGGRKAK